MDPHRQFHNLALIGFMGSGKTSVGRLVATQLQFQFVDTDALIEEQTGKSISDIFALESEPAFRVLEHEVVRQLESRDGLVIATGGGLPTNPSNLTSLKLHAMVVCLWASPDTIWERVRYATHRPLLQTPDPQRRIRELLAERRSFYQQADVIVRADQRDVPEIVQHVLKNFQLVRHTRA